MQISLVCAILGVSLAAPNFPASLENIVSQSPHIKIVGGNETDIKYFPYMVSVQTNHTHFCGGSIISYDTVVTAAHCFSDDAYNISDISLRFGASQWDKGGQEIYADEIVTHENFTKTYGPDYDIAVIKLKENITVENAVPIPLPEANRTYQGGVLANVTGWGWTSEGGRQLSETLRDVELLVVTKEECEYIYGDIINERLICAGYQEGGKDSCSDDSGGPFAINGELAGIISYGYGCARPGIPGVYTFIPAMREWIKQQSGV